MRCCSDRWLRGSKLTEYRSYFDEVLFRQVVARVNLEDEDMVYARRSPPVNVDANQEQEDDHKQRTSEQTHCQPQLRFTGVEDACHHKNIEMKLMSSLKQSSCS